MKVYVIGSLRNPNVSVIAKTLRSDGHEVFDDWMAAGSEADDIWQAYEKERGHTFAEALQGPAAQHVFNFDKKYLQWAEAVVLVMPAGKSGHLELGWALGQGKKGYILLDKEPERFDIMYAFADGVFTQLTELQAALSPTSSVYYNDWVTRINTYPWSPRFLYGIDMGKDGA